ncbi:hypothetical protein DX914_07585 [Lysobacter silvisoli]|uniref:Uncharacterized protein n=1 Tax=Lysobacter silvisoli TaxID=2293254 RepID=A0A371K4U3_9GAMM|nr:hypothetical protein DX914_07585 [Lysobacter silvisoli]
MTSAAFARAERVGDSMAKQTLDTLVRPIAAMLLVAALAACSRTPTLAELEDFAIEVPELMSSGSQQRDIPPASGRRRCGGWSPSGST